MFSCFSSEERRQKRTNRSGDSKLFVMTKVLFDGDSHRPPPGPIAVEMLRQKCPELSEAEAEGLLRENANDMDLAVLAVRRAQRHTSTLGAR